MSIQPLPGNLVYDVTATMPGQYGTGPAGNTVEGWQVHFRLSTGQTGRVFVPDADWPDSERVRSIVEQAARTLATNSSLSGTLS